jgi:polysaccharide biosynthesis/export protein
MSYMRKREAMIRLRFWLLLCVGMICLGFAGLAAAGDSMISIDDVLDISVYNHPEMNTTVRVDGQGMVLLPLINEVKVQGLTVSEAAARIASLLADGYINRPQVNVFVKNFLEQKASILGQVVKPGVYDINRKTTLLELISMAGGLTPEAGDIATLKHEDAKGAKGKSQEIEIALNRLINQGDTSLNVSIIDGDKIFITKAGVFFVSGQVRKPDSYKYQEKLTVMKGITMAGGFTDTASKNSVKIVRKVNGKEKVFTGVDMDTLVLPDDMIVVPESFF